MQTIALSERNIRRNRERIAAESNDLAEFFRRFPEREWLLIGAGPSLDASWNEIARRAAGGARMAVVDQSVAAVLAYGLEPDAVFTCEPRPFPYFSSSPDRRKIARDPRKAPVLIAAANSHPLQLEQFGQGFGGDMIFLNWDWDGPRHPGLQALPPGGNVFNFMLASLGARSSNRLRCFGNDYAAGPGTFYARGVAANEYHRHRRLRHRCWNLETYYQKILHALPEKPDAPRSIRCTAAFLQYEAWQNQYTELLRRAGVAVILDGRTQTNFE
ncbi:MAG: hypothetical protein NXI24_10745 [bacterium]|nr:hypothetical protein [bacterium]